MIRLAKNKTASRTPIPDGAKTTTIPIVAPTAREPVKKTETKTTAVRRLPTTIPFKIK
jgi:hypothetical protein